MMSARHFSAAWREQPVFSGGKKSASFAVKGYSALINLQKSLICVLLLIAALLTYQLKSHFEYATDLTAPLRIDGGDKD